jgi:hypothetical protein
MKDSCPCPGAGPLSLSSRLPGSHS